MNFIVYVDLSLCVSPFFQANLTSVDSHFYILLFDGKDGWSSECGFGNQAGQV